MNTEASTENKNVPAEGADKIAAARAKLAEKFGDNSRTGGKGTQRRKKKTVHKNQLTDDKKLKTVIKKYNFHPLNDISEVNMFKDDGSIMNFKQPEVLASIPSNTVVVMGKSETKSVKDLLPDIIQHLGPKQFEALKDIMKGMKKPGKEGDSIKEAANEDDDGEVPNLVGTANFEEASKAGTA